MKQILTALATGYWLLATIAAADNGYIVGYVDTGASNAVGVMALSHNEAAGLEVTVCNDETDVDSCDPEEGVIPFQVKQSGSYDDPDDAANPFTHRSITFFPLDSYGIEWRERYINGRQFRFSAIAFRVAYTDGSVSPWTNPYPLRTFHITTSPSLAGYELAVGATTDFTLSTQLSSIHVSINENVMPRFTGGLVSDDGTCPDDLGGLRQRNKAHGDVLSLTGCTAGPVMISIYDAADGLGRKRSVFVLNVIDTSN